MIEKFIQTISKQVEIKCKNCKYEGTITATKEYYMNCPKCDELIYVGRLTGAVK